MVAKDKDLLLFKEVCMINQIKYFKRIGRRTTNFSIIFNSFLKEGMVKTLNSKLVNDYSVNFFSNDVDVLIARIKYVQNNVQ